MIFNTHYPYIGGSGKITFAYTGSYTEIDDGGGNWRVKFLTSGTLLPSNDVEVDCFLVGGGGGTRAPSYPNNPRASGAGGGYTLTSKKVKLKANTPYEIVVGAGGNGNNSGEETSAFGFVAAGGLPGKRANASVKGGNGGSGGAGFYTANGIAGSDGGDGTMGGSTSTSDRSIGQGTTTREFGEADGALYSGGGGSGRQNSDRSYNLGTGGAGGGGSAGDGEDNTGGGAGAAKTDTTGGSGIVIIRKAR